jgi:hypothetical protein
MPGAVAAARIRSRGRARRVSDIVFSTYMRSLTNIRHGVRRTLRRVDTGAGPGLRRWLRAGLFGVLLIFTALSTLPFKYHIPTFGFDFSNNFGTNYFSNMGYRYGTDLVFTVGPLGYVIAPEPVANNIAIANLVRFAVWLILLAHLFRLQRLGPRGFWQSLVLMAVLLTTRYPLLIFNYDYFVVTTLLVVVIYLIERPQGWAGYVCMVSLVGLLSLVKLSSYILSILTVALFVAARAGWPPKLPSWKDRLVPVAVLLAAPVAFLVCHVPSFTAFWKYVEGSMAMSAGWSEAASAPIGAGDLFYTAVLSGLFVSGLLYALAKRALPWTTAAVLAFLYWLNWKHGFVRADIHVVHIYAYGIVLAGGLICLLGRRREIVIYSVLFSGFVIIALSGINSYWSVRHAGYWSSAGQRRMALGLMDWDRTMTRLDSEMKKNDPFRRLPDDFRSRLEGSLATVFPWELSYASTRRFRLDPLYVMQSYSAYTRYLDLMTARRIRERYGHVDQVLFEWESLDLRHPLLEVPATWGALFDCYQPELVGDGLMLLAPRKKPLEHRITFLRRVPVPFGKTIDLPRTTAVLWSNISIPHSIRGRFSNFAYKLPAMWLTAGLDSGIDAKFRVIPALLNTPFPMNDMPLDFRSLVALWQSGRVAERVVSIRLDTDAPQDYLEPSMELSTEARAGVEFVEFVAPKRESFESVQKAFHLPALSEIRSQAVGNVEAIDGKLDHYPDEQHPRNIRAGRGVVIEGWAATAPQGVVPDIIFGVLNDHVVRASTVPRPDVAAYFKNSALLRSGFQLSLTRADLPRGPQKVVFFGIVENPKAFYRILPPLWLDVR